MIFHVSIPADDPERVARVIADLWRTEFFPFLYPGSFIVIPDDERGTAIEVLRRGYEQVPAQSEAGLRQNATPSPYCATHINVATRRSEEEILAIADREGWIARVCPRKFFKLIEFWVENKLMLELMTEPEVNRYRSFMSKANWRAVMAAQPLPLHPFGFAKTWLSAPPRPTPEVVLTATID